MSIANLFTPNGYELFSKDINVKSIIAQAVDVAEIDVASLNVVEDLVANKITQTSGFNYLSPWSSTKDYIVGDLVISGSQIWRALLANTNITPDPNNPAQTQWVQLTSNNAILNERSYVQVNSSTGDNTKAQISPVPFANPKNALSYLNFIGGGVAKITTITPTTYLWPGGGFGASNVTLDGGDTSQSALNNPTNTMLGYFVFDNSVNVTIKNVTMGSSSGVAGEIIRTQGTRGFSLENVTFLDPPSPLTSNNIVILSTVSTNFGNFSMINCWVSPDNNDTITVQFGGTCDANTRIIFDNASLPLVSRIVVNTIGITTPENVTLVCRSTTVNVTNCTHFTGSNYLFVDCVIVGTMVSNAASGTVAFYNCTFLDPVTLTWGNLNFNMTGTATYQLVDCLLNPNSPVTSLVSVSSSSYNLTSGPAVRFNRFAVFNAGTSTSLTNGTSTQLTLGTINTNTFSIVGQPTANLFRFLVAGTYEISLSLLVQNTDTTTDESIANVWVGTLGATEGTSISRSSFRRGLTTTANLATYPTSLATITFFIQTATINTDLYFFARNLGATTFTAQINSVNVTQIR